MASIYDQYTLLEVSKRVRTMAPSFWLSYFTKQINFTTAEVLFDKVFQDDRKLAPFVAPNAFGRPQRLEGYETWKFRPAYSKQLDEVDADMHLERLPGEALGTSGFTIDQRRNMVIAELIRRQDVKLDNLLEWMAAMAIMDGKVVIKGEDYPEVTVDFQRDPSLTQVNAGAAKWDQPTSDPLGDIYAMRRNAQDLSGATITRNIFGADAWDAFAAQVDLRDMMDTNFGGQDVKVSLIRDGFMETREFMGYIQGSNGGGRIEAWVDTTRYIDPETGSQKFLVDQGSVIGVSSMVNGVRCFGAIKDKRAGYQAMERFRKNWEQEYPSQEFLLLQSAPIMVPREPNATYKIKAV